MPEEITLARIELAKAREKMERLEDGVEKCDMSLAIGGANEFSRSFTRLKQFTELVSDISVSEAVELEKEMDRLTIRYNSVHARVTEHCECKRKKSAWLE